MKLSYLSSQPDSWHIACSNCGYEDASILQPLPDADGYFSEQRLRAWVRKSPAAQGDFPASCARRQAVLEGLRTVFQHFGERLDAEVRESAQPLTASWHEVKTVGAWQRQFHLYPLDSLESVRSAPRRPVGRSPDLFWDTEIDQALSKVPRSRTTLLEQIPSHVAAHWRGAFEARLGNLQEALSVGEALEASVQALLLVEECRRNGLLTSVVLRVKP